MPGWDDGTSQNLSYVSQPGHDYSSDYPSNILKSVKDQEAQFQKLTREFEADKLIAANQINRSRVDSDTASLNSISETNDSFSWRRSAGQTGSQMDEGSSFVVDVPSSNLLDSCLRELGERNIDDPNMESLQYADPYASPYHGSQPPHSPYGGGDYGHAYDSQNVQDYEPHSDYGSPQHSNYQDYPPSDNGRGDYGYPDAPASNDDYARYPSDPQPHESYTADPRAVEREDPYGTRDRFDGPVDDSSYRSPSPIAPDPYASLPIAEDPYQASPGYKDYARPDDEDPYVSSKQPYEFQEDPRGHDLDLDDRPAPRTLDRTSSHDPFIPPEKAEVDALAGHHEYSTDDEEEAEGDGEFRAPDLQEVIDYLGHPKQSIVAHAAGYIQHLSFQNDDIKTKTREMGGIQPLVGLLGNPLPEIHRSACGSLRNLSYGKAHEENKVKIKSNGGVPALARLLKTSTDEETKELAAGTLWNLSSSEPLKKSIMEDALVVLVANVLIPECGWKASGNSPFKPEGVPWSKTLVNTTGCLRNVSSAGREARDRMRECPGLVDSLLHVIQSSIHSKDMDNKVLENTLCILRNLTFRLANEANHPDAVPLRQPSVAGPDRQGSQQKKSPQSGSLICFGGSKKKDAHASSANGQAGKPDPMPSFNPDVKGVHRLWQPSILTPYLHVLAECSQAASLEAAAGTIQNITAGEWHWSTHIRAAMRKEKGLPILIELLRMKNERAVIAVAKALRNLTLDPRNKDLIGKYGIKDLVERLPPAAGKGNSRVMSSEGLVAILKTMTEVVTRNQENARSLRNASGIERLVSLTRTDKVGNYSAAVIRAAHQVLYALWAHKDLRNQFKKDGWDEKFFHPNPSIRTTLPRKTTMTDGALPPTPSDSENKSQPARANTVPRHGSRNGQSVDEPSEPTRPAPQLSSAHPDEPPPAFDDPYQMAPSPGHHMYDERSVDRDFTAVEDDLMDRLEPYTRSSVSTWNSQDRLDERAVPGEEIAMQPVNQDYADNPYGSLKKNPPVGGVSVYGRAPEPQVDHQSMYSSVLRSTSRNDHPYDDRSYDDRSYEDHHSIRSGARDYGDYRTAQHVQLQSQDEPAGDSWV